MWTDRQLEIIEEHQADMEKDEPGSSTDRDMLIEFLSNRAREEQDNDTLLGAELNEIVDGFLGR